MKYKNIRSALHNFGHSFCSMMNYVEGECVSDVVAKMLRNSKDGTFRIFFPRGVVEDAGFVPRPLELSIGHYQDWLPQLLASHGVDAGKLSEVTLTFSTAKRNSPTTSKSFECDVSCVDDRGVTHAVRVNQRA
jgi:hypothetical protein